MVAERSALLSGRADIARVGDEVHVVLPVRRAQGAALAGLLPVVFLGLVGFPVLILGAGAQVPTLIVVALAAAVVWAIVATAWLTVGREEVVATPGSLELAKVLGPVRRRRRFGRGDVRALRVDVPARDRRISRVDEVAFSGGSIVVETAAGAERFGLRLEPAEARRIVGAIEEAWSR